MLNLPHVIIALCIQLTVLLVTGDAWGGAAAAIFWYLSRELTQAEYRWIKVFGRGKRANMPWWGMFDPRVWNPKSVNDVFSPTIIVVMVALFLC